MVFCGVKMRRALMIVALSFLALSHAWAIKLHSNFYITTSSVPNGTVGVAYSVTFAVNDGTPPYVWSKALGTIPAGLALSSGGMLAGTPTLVGTYSFTVKVTDKKNRSYQQAYSCTISAAPAPAPTLKITTTTLAAGVVGTPYSVSFAATGGSTPYTWSVTLGNLPAGLSLSSGGALSGTPSTANTYSFTITVTDSSSPVQSYSLAFSLVISAAPTGSTLKITTSYLQSSEVAIAYPPQTMAATGGTPPYSWTVISAKGSTGWTAPACTSGPTCFVMPSVSLTLSSGAIWGFNAVSATYAMTIGVTDSSSPPQTYQAAYSAYISPTLIQIVGTNSGGGVGSLYTFTPAAIGGVPPYTWSISSGALPSCYTLDASTGVISGTCNSTGSYNFALTVMDSMGVTYP